MLRILTKRKVSVRFFFPLLEECERGREENEEENHFPSFRMTRVQSLMLNWNRFTEFPLGVLSVETLEVLELGFNQLVLIPPEIRLLSRLTHLIVNDNRLRSLPEELSELSHLSVLSLDYNHLQALPQQLCQCTSLREIRLTGNADLLFPPASFALGASCHEIMEFLSTHSLSSLSISSQRDKQTESHSSSTASELGAKNSLFVFRFIIFLFIDCVRIVSSCFLLIHREKMNEVSNEHSFIMILLMYFV